METTKAYIGLGSNMGEREASLRQAVELLDATDGVEVTNVSSIYETEPVGYLDQPDFLNAVVEIETSLSARKLLLATKEIERLQERRRDVRWGPRTIDLDILLFGNVRISEPDLRVPHVEVSNRAFVLAPLAEIAPDLTLPDGQKIRDLLAALGKLEGVRVYRPGAARLDLPA